MKHSVLAPTYRDAERLTNAIQGEGWDARIINAHGFVGVIIHFEPARTLCHAHD